MLRYIKKVLPFGLLCQYSALVTRPPINFCPLLFQSLPRATIETKSRDSRATIEASNLEEDGLLVSLYEKVFTPMYRLRRQLKLGSLPFVPTPRLTGEYYLQPPSARGIFKQDDLLCNGTCSVTGGA